VSDEIAPRFFPNMGRGVIALEDLRVPSLELSFNLC